MAQQKPLKEFQAVILAGGSGSGLYPFTVDMSVSLLPVGTASLLSYQLWALEKAGFKEVIVVCPAKYLDEYNRFVSEVYSGSIVVDVNGIEDEEGKHFDEEGAGSVGSANGLRLLKDKIHSDFIVFAGDVVTTASLNDLADVHRVNNAAVTVLLKQHKDSRDKESQKVLKKLNKNVINYFGLVRDGESSTARLVYMKNAPEDDSIDVPKSLLVRHPHIQFHTDLIDPHVYVVRKWVFDLLCTTEASPLCQDIRMIQSLRSEYLPFIVNQLQQRLAEPGALGDQSLGESPKLEVPHIQSAESTQRLAVRLSANEVPDHGDFIGCYAYIAPTETIMCRANTLFAYNLINQQINDLPSEVTTPFPKPPRHARFKDAIVGLESEIGENVLLKNCIIGAHCKIGAGAMLSNSVVMDHCTIGSECVIQSSIVGSNATIVTKCNLNEVQLQGGSMVVKQGSRLKGQAYLRTDFA